MIEPESTVTYEHGYVEVLPPASEAIQVFTGFTSSTWVSVPTLPPPVFDAVGELAENCVHVFVDGPCANQVHKLPASLAHMTFYSALLRVTVNFLPETKFYLCSEDRGSLGKNILLLRMEEVINAVYQELSSMQYMGNMVEMATGRFFLKHLDVHDTLDPLYQQEIDHGIR